MAEQSVESSCVTGGGSTPPELLHPNGRTHPDVNVSETVIPVGKSSLIHRATDLQRVYYVAAGDGLVQLAGGQFEVHEGDTVSINPALEHRATNTGDDPLRITCALTPSPQSKGSDLVSTAQQ